MKRIRILCLVVLLVVVFNQAKGTKIQHTYSTGLVFQASEVNKDERTSLDLLPKGPIRLDGGFSMAFDLKLTDTWESFGYIFRIVLNDSTSLDLTAFVRYRNMKLMLNNVEKKKVVSEYTITNDFLQKEWVKVVLRVDPTSVNCTIDGKTITIQQSIRDFQIEKIFFGVNRYKSFFTSDIPPMTIRNLQLSDRNGQLVRDWELAKHGQDVVYDKIKKSPAFVKNGVWKMDHHTKWRKERSLYVAGEFPQLAVDSLHCRVFVATKDSLYTLYLGTDKTEAVPVKGGQPFQGASSYLIYDYEKNQLISYHVKQDQLLYLDLNTHRWSGKPLNSDLWIQHHNRLIDPETRSLVLFGGYGVFRYKSHLQKHALDGGSWTSTDLIKSIYPRYLASMGYLGGGKMMVLGGYGNESGVQEVGARNFYDLFKIDFRQNTCELIGKINNPPSHYVYGNSLVIGRYNQLLYTLGYRNDVYKTSIKLFELDLKTFNYRLLGDSIPYRFQDTESFCDLFRYKESHLYALMSEKKANNLNLIQVYSLAYPPMPLTDVLQAEPIAWAKKSLYLLLTGLLLLTGILFVLVWLKKRKRVAVVYPSVNPVNKTERQHAAHESPKISSILLLGGFEILDKKGRDLAENFTPIIRQLFLRCLLESYESGKGVTSKTLEETIWFDMDKASATNNRNVNIRKLRLLLQEIGEVSLVKENNYWTIKLSDCFCDYLSVVNILNEIAESDSISKAQIETLVKLAAPGPLLPHFDLEWADRYKSSYSSRIIQILIQSTTQEDVSKDLKLLVDLTDVILTHDNLDEESIRIKCQSLYKLGQKGLSKHCFDKFCADYQTILNEQPRLTYAAIISNLD